MPFKKQQVDAIEIGQNKVFSWLGCKMSERKPSKNKATTVTNQGKCI